ncbi:MAG: hypothetical protein ACE3JK_03655 [Sporolactobacillus sp.]
MGVALGFIIDRHSGSTIILIVAWSGTLFLSYISNLLLAPNPFIFMYCQLRFPEFRLTADQQAALDAEDKRNEQAHLNWERERERKKKKR